MSVVDLIKQMQSGEDVRMARVSVVLTSFNHGKYIREAIDSVLAQTFVDFELIIWDDASSDDSWQVISSYSDPRIKAFRNEVNMRPIFGVIKAISEVATGEFIAMHHSDDIWELNKLELQVSFLDAHSEIGAVFTNALAITEDGSTLVDKQHIYTDIFNQPNRTRHQWLWFFFNHGNALCHPSVLIRKSCYEDCGLYSYGVAQSGDFNMWIRLCMKYEIHIIPERLVRFRVRDNEANTSGSRPETRIRCVYEFYKILDLFHGIRDKDEFFKVFPAMVRYDRGEDTDTEFVLAMTAFEEVTFCTKQLFGTDILYRLLSDPVRAKKIEELYGFGYKEFISLTGRYDFFSREELSGLRQQLQAQVDQSASLNQVIVEKDDVIRQQDEEVARLSNEIEAFRAEIETQRSEMQCLRDAAPEKGELIDWYRKKIDELDSEIARVNRFAEQLSCNWREAQIYLHSLRLDFAQTVKTLAALQQTNTQNEATLAALQQTNTQNEATLAALRGTKVFRLREVLLHHPWGIRKLLHITYLVVALLTPRFLRVAAAPLTARLREIAATTPSAVPASHVVPSTNAETVSDAEAASNAELEFTVDPESLEKPKLSEEHGGEEYLVGNSKIARPDAPKIAHVIANFMRGGSSRLVVDLIEYLGSEYRQSVITSLIPTPPAYVGLDIEECRDPGDESPFVEYFQRTQPNFVHVHYWGSSDEPWYAKAILAAERLGLPVIENINTPVAPYLSEAVVRYVYVSDYARRVFGRDDPSHITIYPGSNFLHFDRNSGEALPDNCVGMVYRLERDKLDERSIEPFIRIAQRRPQTRILIVGGGSLLEPFQEAVHSAGVSQAFEFTGYVGYEELPDLYRRMTVFVVPVWKESFGQVSPFAMNMRIPVIGYGVGAIGEIVEAPELLAPPGDAEKLADIAIKLLDNSDQRETIGEMQRNRAEANFSLQAMIRGYAKIYAEMRRQCLTDAVREEPHSPSSVNTPAFINVASQRGSSRPQSMLSKIAGDFDREFYLRMYPDIATSGVNPEEHFHLHGRREGRMGCPPDLDLTGRFESFDIGRDTVLVVSHEASLTGAPILSLNLVQVLAKRYNVVAVLLGGGPIENAFEAAGVVVRAFSARANAFIAELVLESLLKHCSLKFALVNSIESRAFLPALAKRYIPAITLIHEFAAYTRPREAFREAFFWSTETVFSTKITVESALSELPDLTGETSYVLPQGCCLLPSLENNLDRLERDRKRILNVFHPQNMSTRPFVVLGAGSVQLRKGIDLFIECASRVVRSTGGENYRFVWIGSGFDADHDTNYSVYLADQIRRSGLEDVIIFLGETLAIDTAYQEADILLLSSRLDPLPNVAIDALVHGLPVLCFDKTTGIADILAEEGFGPTCVADYLDTHDMAEKIVSMATSKALLDDIGARSRMMALRRFNMDSYVQALEKLAIEACARKKQERVDIDDIVRSGLLRADFVSPQHSGNISDEEAIISYVRGWATGIGCRKPLPGFHPGVYQENHGVSIPGSDPFADYLRSGRPDGAWVQPVIATPIKKVNSLPEGIRVALHLHVYYPELLDDMLNRLRLNVLKPDLFVSVPDDAACQFVIDRLQDYQGKVARVVTVPNRGRDIGPFLSAFGADIVANYDIVGHLHTKVSSDLKDAMIGKNWYDFLLENLLGGQGGGMADAIVAAMVGNPSIGLVFPDDPYLVGWDGNKRYAEPLAAKLGFGELPEHFNFPVGTMFWARVEKLRPLFDLGLSWDDYPEEPLPYDGSILHAIERIFPFLCNKEGGSCAVTNVPEITR